MMEMDVFYNPTGVGDVLIIPVKDGERDEVSHKQYGDITKITGKVGEVLGYNIFQASTHFEFEETGKLAMTEAMLSKLKTLFNENQLTDPLDFDLTPKFVVGYVISKSPHENADKLSVCQVDVADETLQIVCGAPDVDKDQKVVVAKEDATMTSGVKIKTTELTGVPSNGMICWQKDLSVPDATEETGIYALDDAYHTGAAFIS